MSINIVMPDPPFFTTSKLVEYCNDMDVDIHIYDNLAAGSDLLRQRISCADIAIVDLLSQYDRDVLKDAVRLKYLITATVGMDHIDLAYCRELGIQVANCPSYNARAVAEMAFANLISLLRRVYIANQSVRAGLWLTDYFDGEELQGKTLGVVGAGNIGRELIRIGLGYGMRIACNTLHPSAERANRLGIDSFLSLDEVLEVSDFLVLVLPASAETNNIIDAHALARMKPSAYLVNEGRHTLVDSRALAAAIYQKSIAGAALDFVGPEPYSVLDDDPAVQELVNRPNVMVTPHIGFNTREAAERLANSVYEKVVGMVEALT